MWRNDASSGLIRSALMCKTPLSSGRPRRGPPPDPAAVNVPGVAPGSDCPTDRPVTWADAPGSSHVVDGPRQPTAIRSYHGPVTASPPTGRRAVPTTEWTPPEREREQHEPAVVRGMAGLAALLVACVLVAAGAYLVFVRTRWGQSVDQAVLQGRDVANARTRHGAARILQTISVGSLGLGALGLACIGVLRNRWRLALAVLTSVMGAVLTTELLKKVILTPPRRSSPSSSTRSTASRAGTRRWPPCSLPVWCSWPPTGTGQRP